MEWFGPWPWRCEGEVPRVHTPSITLMRLSVPHLFSLSDKPEVSGFCPLEASLVIFVFLFPFANSKGLEWLGASRRSLSSSRGESEPPQAQGRGGHTRVTGAHGGAQLKSGFLPGQLAPFGPVGTVPELASLSSVRLGSEVLRVPARITGNPLPAYCGSPRGAWPQWATSLKLLPTGLFCLSFRGVCIPASGCQLSPGGAWG